MKIRAYVIPILLLAAMIMGACDNYKEEAPLSDKIPNGYRMPDPQTLTDSDRAVINAMQDEYDKNGNN